MLIVEIENRKNTKKSNKKALHLHDYVIKYKIIALLIKENIKKSNKKLYF